MVARWTMFAALALAACGASPHEETLDVEASAEEDASIAVDLGAEDRRATDAGPDVARDAAADDSADAMDSARDVGWDAGVDVAVDGGDAGTDAPTATGTALYTADRALSPITEDLARRWRAVLAGSSGQARVFSKVGASNTVNTNFAACFAGGSVDLAGRDALRATVDWFRAGDAGGTDPYRRVSLAATVGWSAWAALSGTPPPLDRELDAARPTHATVMFGTNDIQSRNLDRYGDNLLTIVDRLLARGVIPHLTAVPPRDDDPAADAWVDRYNAVSRAVAQSRGVPFIDLHRELVGLPSHGVGSDGIHLNVYTAGGAARGCVFSAAGLRYGHNVRNLLTLESLDRALAVTARGGAAPDPSAPRMQGDGSLASPIEVPSLPFVDVRDTSRGGFSRVDRYPGCASSADESGPEFLYRLALTRATTVRAVVVSRPGVDVDIHALTGAATGAACVARDDRSVRVNLGPGTHYFSLDTYVSAGRPRVGEFIVALLAE